MNNIKKKTGEQKRERKDLVFPCLKLREHLLNSKQIDDNWVFLPANCMKLADNNNKVMIIRKHKLELRRNVEILWCQSPNTSNDNNVELYTETLKQLFFLSANFYGRLPDGNIQHYFYIFSQSQQFYSIAVFSLYSLNTVFFVTY